MAAGISETTGKELWSRQGQKLPLQVVSMSVADLRDGWRMVLSCFSSALLVVLATGSRRSDHSDPWRSTLVDVFRTTWSELMRRASPSL